ncbi:hypothetical protein V6N11_024975 [Hibiscus sabdariffa]|uniref:Uncharacterized protein n=1 Tax=Hibiscus sabdariffa TaxID=183260 RepID=A0ABR2QNQ5_9ROSI
MFARKQGGVVQLTANKLSDSINNLWDFDHPDSTNKCNASPIAHISTLVGSVKPMHFENVVITAPNWLRKIPPMSAMTELPLTAASTLNFSSPWLGGFQEPDSGLLWWKLLMFDAFGHLMNFSNWMCYFDSK